MDKLEERLRRRSGGWKSNISYADDAGPFINPDGPEAADEITRLNAEVERLSGDLRVEQVRAQEWRDIANRETSNAEKAEALIDEMVEGLEPFAIDCAHAGIPTTIPDDANFNEVDCSNSRLTVRDFRRARALILKARGKDANVG